MALTRTFTLYSGADASPVLDYTDDTDWTQTELATGANLGQGSAGQWLVRDEGGLLPDYVPPTRFIAGHNVVKVTVGSNTLFRGRVAAQEQFRGRQKAGRANEISVTLEDQNAQLRGIVVHNWVRGAETDVARAQALVALCLSGSPRGTTNLNGSNLVITTSNTISLPAKTYSGVTPYEILTELASNADKEMFVTVDDQLAYFGHDYTGYDSLLRISDDPADQNATTYAPWDPRSNWVGRENLTRLRTYYGTDTTQSSVQVGNSYFDTFYDYWEDVFWDSESTTADQAIARAAKMLSYRSQDDVSLSCMIGPMSGDEVWKIKPGQRISFKARAARSGRLATGVYAGDSFFTTRVREIRWIMPAEDIYIARLELERPKHGQFAGRGSKALVTAPKPAPPAAPGTPEGATLYKFFDADDGGDTLTWTGILTNQVGGAEGSGFYYFKSSAPNNYSLSMAATAGTIYRFTGYTHIASGNNLKVAFRNDAAGSTGAITDGHASVIEVDILQAGPTSKWTPFSQDLTAPTGTTSLSLGRGGSSCDFDRVRIFTVTPGSPSPTTDPYALDDPGTSPYYVRSDDPRLDNPLPSEKIWLFNNFSLDDYPAGPDALDDEFEDSGSLDAKWTKVNDPSGADALNQSDFPGFLHVGLAELGTDNFASIVQLYQTAPTGTQAMTYIAKVALVNSSGTTALTDAAEFAHVGIGLINSTNSQSVAAVLQFSDGYATDTDKMPMSPDAQQDGVTGFGTVQLFPNVTPGQWVYLRFRKTTASAYTSANTYEMDFSLNGLVWHNYASGSKTFTTACDRVGLLFRRPKSATGTPFVEAVVDFFRRTA